MKILRIIFKTIIIIFAGIGVIVTFVFIAMEYGLLNVPGSIDTRNESFGSVPTTTAEIIEKTNGCREGLNQLKPCEWDETAQWDVVKGGLLKDAEIIKRVSSETGVSSRMIVASVIPEQIRFFSDNRETFKRYFEPLKLLASLSKFSLGVSGIKQETALRIEQYAQDATSPFYPGDTIAPLLAYTDEIKKSDTALFDRLTNEDDHYYSYLYTAIYLREITAHWKNAGFDVSERPDVLVTLFNLGFDISSPKENPQVGGANITVGGKQYSFGYLGTLFYQSEEMTNIFTK